MFHRVQYNFVPFVSLRGSAFRHISTQFFPKKPDAFHLLSVQQLRLDDHRSHHFFLSRQHGEQLKQLPLTPTFSLTHPLSAAPSSGANASFRFLWTTKVILALPKSTYRGSGGPRFAHASHCGICTSATVLFAIPRNAKYKPIHQENSAKTANPTIAGGSSRSETLRHTATKRDVGSPHSQQTGGSTSPWLTRIEVRERSRPAVARVSFWQAGQVPSDFGTIRV
jgi:hypothetical protein